MLYLVISDWSTVLELLYIDHYKKLRNHMHPFGWFYLYYDKLMENAHFIMVMFRLPFDEFGNLSLMINMI